MTPGQALIDGMWIALNEDPATLAQPTDNNKMVLLKADFTPSPNLDPLTITKCDFTGYADILVPLDAQVIGVDPLTNQKVIRLKEPLGGYNWLCTGTANLPQNAFGWIVLNDSENNMWGCGKFPAPIVINNGVMIGLTPAQISFILALVPIS
jgi:hypothetical protein